MLQPRLAVRAVRRTVFRGPPLSQRRFDSSHSPDDGHGHDGSKPETFKASFYVALIGVPCFVWVLASARQQDPDHPSWITRLIAEYTAPQSLWEERNSRHTALVEKAAFDRNLFETAPRPPGPPVRFPESLNRGSPYNVGTEASVDLRHAIQHCQEQNRAVAQRIAGKSTAERNLNI